MKVCKKKGDFEKINRSQKKHLNVVYLLFVAVTCPVQKDVMKASPSMQTRFSRNVV